MAARHIKGRMETARRARILLACEVALTALADLRSCDNPLRHPFLFYSSTQPRQEVEEL